MVWVDACECFSLCFHVAFRLVALRVAPFRFDPLRFGFVSVRFGSFWLVSLRSLFCPSRLVSHRSTQFCFVSLCFGFDPRALRFVSVSFRSVLFRLDPFKETTSKPQHCF